MFHVNKVEGEEEGELARVQHNTLLFSKCKVVFTAIYYVHITYRLFGGKIRWDLFTLAEDIFVQNYFMPRK